MDNFDEVKGHPTFTDLKHESELLFEILMRQSSPGTGPSSGADSAGETAFATPLLPVLLCPMAWWKVLTCRFVTGVVWFCGTRCMQRQRRWRWRR